MDVAMLILTLIGTGAAVISAVIAVRAKNEARSILIKVKDARKISSSVVNMWTDNSGSSSCTVSHYAALKSSHEKRRPFLLDLLRSYLAVPSRL
jgi:hypothetical protein